MAARTDNPGAVIEATSITDVLTGAISAVGAKHLGPSKPSILGYSRARRSAYGNVRLLEHLFDFEGIKIHSHQPDNRNASDPHRERILGKPSTVTDHWHDCLKNTAIMAEA